MKLADVYSGEYVLESERLLFRPIAYEDAPDMYEYCKDPDVSRYLLWTPHTSVGYTKRHIAWAIEGYREGRFFDFAVIEKVSRRMIGTCGFTSIDRENASAEIGYVFSKDYWGCGFGKEAILTVLAFAFLSLSFHRVEARFMEENIASRRVAEKCGMTVEGYYRDKLYVKGGYRTIGVASILKDEFISQNPYAVSSLRRAREGDLPQSKKKGFFAFLFG